MQLQSQAEEEDKINRLLSTGLLVPELLIPGVCDQINLIHNKLRKASEKARLTCFISLWKGLKGGGGGLDKVTAFNYKPAIKQTIPQVTTKHILL